VARAGAGRVLTSPSGRKHTAGRFSPSCAKTASAPSSTPRNEKLGYRFAKRTREDPYMLVVGDREPRKEGRARSRSGEQLAAMPIEASPRAYARATEPGPSRQRQEVTYSRPNAHAERTNQPTDPSPRGALIDVDGTQTSCRSPALSRSPPSGASTWSRSPPPPSRRCAGSWTTASTATRKRKKAAESRKKATRVVVKEVKLGSQTDDHDVAFKVNHIRRFLDEGMRVKVSVFFAPGDHASREGQEMLDLVMSKIEDVATQELRPRLEGRSMSMMVVPK